MSYDTEEVGERGPFLPGFVTQHKDRFLQQEIPQQHGKQQQQVRKSFFHNDQRVTYVYFLPKSAGTSPHWSVSHFRSGVV